MRRYDLSREVFSVKELTLIGEIVTLHNIVWGSSTGIIDLLKSSSRCFYVCRASGFSGHSGVEGERDRQSPDEGRDEPLPADQADSESQKQAVNSFVQESGIYRRIPHRKLL
jgi:hypothetical protein